MSGLRSGGEQVKIGTVGVVWVQLEDQVSFEGT